MNIDVIGYAFGDTKIDQQKKYSESFTNKTGIENVYENTSSSIDLIRQAFRNADGKDYKNTDVILHVTQSEHSFIPNDASLIQDFSGINNNVLSLTINQGCSGFVQALGIANSLIESYGYKQILIITNDHYRKFIDVTDRATDALFSDCAVITSVNADDKFKVKKFINYTNGRGSKYLFRNKNIEMDGIEVFKFTKNIVIKDIIKKNIKSPDEDDSFYYIHQASAFVLNEIYQYLPENRCFSNLKSYGNTISSTIPLLLKDFPLNKCKNYFIGFGVGLSASFLELDYQI